MKLDFLSIRAKNFMQIGNDYAEFNLHKDPFTVIVGKNGTGKSTLLDMICYVLFNKPYRVKFTLSQLVNSTNKKQMVVEVAFKVGNQSYVVRRGEKPKVFEIYKDKELIKADPSIGDMQTYLETQILKQGFKSFCQINVIGKSSYKQFLTLTPAERRAVVEDILDSSIYSDMAALAKVDYKTLSTEIDQYVSDMRILESQIQNTDALIRRYEADRSEEVDRVKRQITETESAIATTKELISEVEARIETAETNLNSVIPPQHLNRFNDERTKLISAIGGFDSAKSKANITLSKIDSMSTCPHCLQVVDANHKAEISQAARDEIAQADENLNLLKSKLAKMDEIRHNYDQAKGELNDVKSSRIRLDSEISNSSKTLDQLHDNVKRLSSVQPVADLPDLSALRSDLTNVMAARDAAVVQRVKLKSAIDLLGDDGIKAKLINKYIPTINKYVNMYLERMNMYVEFNLDNEFNESVNAVNRESFTYYSFSEGQKIRIDLAILLTWRKISQIRSSMSTNIFILDEVTDGSMDADGVTEFLSILRDVADVQNTFIISHSEGTIDLFDNVIRTETVGNYTRYTSE